MTDQKKITDQVRFCSVLMGRIKNDIETAEPDSFGREGILRNYTTMQTDVIRLRRELNTLRKMLNPWDNRD